MSASPQRSSMDLVPLDERLLYLRVLRAVIAAATVLDAALLPHLLRRPFLTVAMTAFGYLVICLLLEGLWRALRRPGLWLFGVLLMIDGVYLAWASYLTGGSNGPLRYLILVHLGAVTLLASYRTGVKLALWHSLLQLCVYYAERANIIRGATSSDEWFRMAAFVVALWTLTLTISTLAAVNERELRRRRYELEQLAQMGRALEEAHDPLAVGDVLLDNLSDTFGFRRMALFEVVEDSPRLLTCRSLLDAVVADFALGNGSVLKTAANDRTTLLVTELDAAVDPWLAAIMPDARNIAVVPLTADEVVGVLVAETGRRAGSRIERRVVAMTERFAGHTALAMRNANLLERMQQMAVTDGLTELANRRSFDRALDRELQRASRTDGRLSVVLLDVDHFKQLNDTHGHLVGDNVLREIAKALRLCGREYDTIARYGGEEFAAVLPGCSSALAVQVAERLRQSVQECGSDVPVTASCGVATYPYDGVDVESLLGAADRALYSAKRAGRNRVFSAETARAVAAS
ncbi:MAG TPA: sensor domain-containing diguanylate cyclase [Mycobacteriales bacterium]|nr:sensor domain-containing diguanylate cyclase [Mycobacteriales bacterium]